MVDKATINCAAKLQMIQSQREFIMFLILFFLIKLIIVLIEIYLLGKDVFNF